MQRRNLLASALLGGAPAIGAAGAWSDRIAKVEVLPARVPYRSTFVIGLDQG